MNKFFLRPINVIVVLAITVASLLTFVYPLNKNKQEEVIKPEKDKDYRWTDKEGRENQKRVSSKNNKPATAGTINIKGKWVARGPYNMPGCWEMTEFDERTNTVWGVTCAHYGGSNFIFKGTLDGDDFEIINQNEPHRFVDIFFVPIGTNGTRFVAGITGGGIIYTDDDGETWNESSGILGSVQSITVNRQQNNAIYACDSNYVYKSLDGITFTVFKDFGSDKLSRIYSPRYDVQQDADQVYVAHGGDFFRLNTNKTDFVQANYYGPWPITDYKRFAIGGDSRKLYVTNHERWFISTDHGATWNEKSNGASRWSGHFIAAHPESPDTVALGYLNPTFSYDGMNTQFSPDIWWIQQLANHPTPDDRHRVRIHADHQATQFYYDKDGKLLTLHSTDGGLFKSYNCWKISDWSTQYNNNVFYNLNLYGTQSCEIYTNAIASGKRSLTDFVIGTQDQGTQTSTNVVTPNGSVHVLQSPYGDGPKFIGDGENCYMLSANQISPAFSLYNGNTFVGLANKKAYSYIGIGNFKGVIMDPNTSVQRVWLRSSNKVAYFSNEGWWHATTVFTASGNDVINGIGKGIDNSLYVLSGNKLYKSNDNGSSWGNGMPTGLNTTSTNCAIAVSKTNSNELVIASPGEYNNSMYSDDGGLTFTDVSDGIDNVDIRDVCTTKDGIYAFASTSMGPYVFEFNQKQWFSLTTNTDMPWFNGNSMELIQDSVIRFSTWGTGIYDFIISEDIVTSTSTIIENTSEISVYPNPTVGYVYLPRVFEMVLLKTSTGIRLKEFRNTKQIDLSEYSAGTYMIQIIEKGKVLATKKVIKK